jgi:hypothetical protein
MKKSLITVSILSLLFICNISFAYESDCLFVSWIDLKNGLSESMEINYKNSLWKELLTEKGLLRAVRNLKKYCCFNLNWAKDDKTCKKVDYDDIKDDYPKTPYLLDHILNIMLRRLWPKTYEGLDLDEKAAKREEELEKFATDPEWALPQKLDTLYKEYWLNNQCWDDTSRNKFKSKNPKYIISHYDWTSIWTFISKIENTEQWGTSINDREKFKKINERDLTTKYLNLCQVGIYLSAKQWRFDNSDQNTILIQKNCLNKVNDILQKKATLYWKLITTQSNLLMQNTLTNYNNYLTSRSTTVDSSATKANNYLFWVLRLIQQVTLKCS